MSLMFNSFPNQSKGHSNTIVVFEEKKICFITLKIFYKRKSILNQSLTLQRPLKLFRYLCVTLSPLFEKMVAKQKH